MLVCSQFCLQNFLPRFYANLQQCHWHQFAPKSCNAPCHYRAYAIMPRPRGKREEGENEKSAYRCGFVFPPLYSTQVQWFCHYAHWEWFRIYYNNMVLHSTGKEHCVLYTSFLSVLLFSSLVHFIYISKLPSTAREIKRRWIINEDLIDRASVWADCIAAPLILILWVNKINTFGSGNPKEKETEFTVLSHSRQFLCLSGGKQISASQKDRENMIPSNINKKQKHLFPIGFSYMLYLKVKVRIGQKKPCIFRVNNVLKSSITEASPTLLSLVLKAKNFWWICTASSHNNFFWREKLIL